MIEEVQKLIEDIVTHDQLQEVHKIHSIHMLAMVKLLFDKGIISPEEIERYRIKATSVIDQGWARRRDEAAKEALKR